LKRWNQAIEVTKAIKSSNARIKLFGGDLNEMATLPNGPVVTLLTSFMKDSLEETHPG